MKILVVAPDGAIAVSHASVDGADVPEPGSQAAAGTSWCETAEPYVELYRLLAA